METFVEPTSPIEARTLYQNFYSDAVRPETPPHNSEIFQFDHIRAVPPLGTPNSQSKPKPPPKLSLSVDSIDDYRTNHRYRTNYIDNITLTTRPIRKPLIRSLSQSDIPVHCQLPQTIHPILDNLPHPRSPDLIASSEPDLSLPPIVHHRRNSDHLQSSNTTRKMHRNCEVQNYTYAAMVTPQKFSNKDNSPTAVDFI